MKGITKIAAVTALTGTLSACAGFYSAPLAPPMGMLYSDIQAPLSIEPEGTKLGNKVGEASSTNILGLYAVGDVSVAAAAEAGGITTVRHIDYKMKNLLGVLSTFTIVVHGD
ncbi:MAG: TRL-like family protein [Gammaproteobacteria bacterium]|nr:TRL-like family protein [Gammaproteobacteria bacterium]